MSPRVKIYLEEGETEQEALEQLEKASKKKEEAHFEEFPDNTMEKTASRMKKEYKKLRKQMMDEIRETLKNKHNLDV